MQAANVFEKFKVIGIHAVLTFDDGIDPADSSRKLFDKCKGQPFQLVACFDFDEIYFRDETVKAVSDGDRWETLEDLIERKQSANPLRIEKESVPKRDASDDSRDGCRLSTVSTFSKGNGMKFRKWDVTIERGKYIDGNRMCLTLLDENTGEKIAVATVNLPDQPLKENEVFINDYSENHGMLEFLESNGIVKSTGEFIKSGYVMIPKCVLL
jgi:hypothetical protein